MTRWTRGELACIAVLEDAGWQQVQSCADVVLACGVRGVVRVFGGLRAVSWGVLVRAACFASRLVRIFCQLKITREEHSSRDAFVLVARGFRAGVFLGASRAWYVPDWVSRVACIGGRGAHMAAAVGWVSPVWSSGITVRFLKTGF